MIHLIQNYNDALRFNGVGRYFASCVVDCLYLFSPNKC